MVPPGQSDWCRYHWQQRKRHSERCAHRLAEDRRLRLVDLLYAKISVHRHVLVRLTISFHPVVSYSEAVARQPFVHLCRLCLRAQLNRKIPESLVPIALHDSIYGLFRYRSIDPKTDSAVEHHDVHRRRESSDVFTRLFNFETEFSRRCTKHCRVRSRLAEFKNPRQL